MLKEFSGSLKCHEKHGPAVCVFSMAPKEPRWGPGLHHKILKSVCSDNMSLADVSNLDGGLRIPEPPVGRQGQGERIDVNAFVLKSAKISVGHCLNCRGMGTGPTW